MKWIVLAAVAMFALPATASAAISPSDYKNAAKYCKALRADVGADAFKEANGTNKNKRNAFGKCVSKNARLMHKLHAQAVAECKAAAQSTKPETHPGKGNSAEKQAFRDCVKSKFRELKAEARDAVENAAKECQTERTTDPVAFREKYGTNENKSNAFGKCVSKTVRANQESQQS
jgi:hypothetical protein